jgi:hypothetical protein
LPSGIEGPLTNDDFEDFLDWRVERLTKELKTRIGEFATPEHSVDPQLSRLNVQVERVELDLRELVSARLLNDPTRLAPHIAQRAREQAAATAKREPSDPAPARLDLAGLLEFLDLRGLEEAITSKLTWPDFAEIFPSKELLSTRFNQLAHLRNAIRHTRRVGDITRKDGEASLMWFEQVLDGKMHIADSANVAEFDNVE